MKIRNVIVFSILVIGLFSCKKDYTCVCTSPTGKTIAFTVKTTEKKATAQCNDYYNSNYGSTAFDQTKCEIE